MHYTEHCGRDLALGLFLINILKAFRPRQEVADALTGFYYRHNPGVGDDITAHIEKHQEWVKKECSLIDGSNSLFEFYFDVDAVGNNISHHFEDENGDIQNEERFEAEYERVISDYKLMREDVYRQLKETHDSYR